MVISWVSVEYTGAPITRDDVGGVVWITDQVPSTTEPDVHVGMG